MFQASSLFANTELTDIPAWVYRSFALDALVVGLIASLLITLVVVYAGSDFPLQHQQSSGNTHKLLVAWLIFGTTGGLFFAGVTFFTEIVLLTTNLGTVHALGAGALSTVVSYVVLAVLVLLIFLMKRAPHATSEFFHRHPLHHG